MSTVSVLWGVRDSYAYGVGGCKCVTTTITVQSRVGERDNYDYDVGVVGCERQLRLWFRRL